MSNSQPYDEAAERAKAERVMEKYFDTDIQDAASAYDVLVDNGVNHQFAAGLSVDMFPDDGESQE